MLNPCGVLDSQFLENLLQRTSFATSERFQSKSYPNDGFSTVDFIAPRNV